MSEHTFLLGRRMYETVLANGEPPWRPGARIYVVSRTLGAARQVDAIELTIVPVLLGSGVPVVTALPARASLTLTKSHVYPSGMVALHYSLPDAAE